MNGKHSKTNFRKWLNSLTKNEFDLWREAVAQLRQLHGDIWNGVKFFLAVNGIIVAAIATVFKDGDESQSFAVISTLAVTGLLLTIVALGILKRHRTYYLDMLLKKSLIEKELGFYDIVIESTELSFQWNVPKEKLHQLRVPETWKKSEMWRRSSIAFRLLAAYWFLIVIYALMLILLLVSLLKSRFICFFIAT